MPIIAKLLSQGHNSSASPAGPHDDLVRQKPEDGKLDWKSIFHVFMTYFSLHCQLFQILQYVMDSQFYKQELENSQSA